MAIGLKPSAGSGSSITSIASGSDSKCIINENCETTLNESGVVLKVWKPYTISKQREKWTEEEHYKFIEALKLYGRAWRQIEEYIGTKTAVQIRSHAQKFFSKVMKEGASSAGASTEPIEIPPPRPKRKPAHPYPRKFVEAPNKAKQYPSHVENGRSINVKTLGRDVHSPISVLPREGSQISTSHATTQGSGCASRTSSGSNLCHVDEKSTLVKDSSVQGKEKENEENLSLPLNLSGPSLDNSTVMSAGKLFKEIESTKDEDNCSENRFKFVRGDPPTKCFRLFGHTVAVANQPEYSDSMQNVAVHPSRGNKFTVFSGGILMGNRPIEKEGSKGFSCTGSKSNSFTLFCGLQEGIQPAGKCQPKQF